MNIYIPFTYIIGWSKYKKFYYGAKYAQGCQPSDLWESYFTSSEYVEEFRKEYGEPDIIKIHRTFLDKSSCILFEHQYLTKIGAKNHPMFLNKSNGNKSFVRDDDMELKIKETCLERYGFDNPSKSPIVKEKIKETCLEKYGFEYALSSPIVHEKIKETCLEKYGFEYALSSPIIREKAKETCLEKYGFDSSNKSPIVKEKKKKTYLEKYGFEYALSSPDVHEKKKQTLLAKYDVDNIAKVPFLSILETKKTYNKSTLSRYYPDFKQFY